MDDTKQRKGCTKEDIAEWVSIGLKKVLTPEKT